jgi:hypothetical protein
MTNTLPPSETTTAPEKPKPTGLRVSKKHAAELNEAIELYCRKHGIERFSISDMVGLLARQYTKGKA